MSPEQKQLNMLGLASRAGALVTGDEFVEKAIKDGSAPLVIVASDCSEATKTRYQGFAERYAVTLNETFTREQISQALGKSRSIVAMTNRGMIKSFLSYTAD